MQNSTYNSRNQRHAIELERVMDNDRAFFARDPARSHRIRLATPCEVRDFTAREGRPITPGPGLRWFAVVHQIRPGARFRLFAALPSDTSTNGDEAHARALWEKGAPPGSDFSHAVRKAREFGL